MKWLRVIQVSFGLIIGCLVFANVLLQFALGQEEGILSGEDSKQFLPLIMNFIDTQTNRVSVASDGTQANGDSSKAVISADGRYVAFESEATNLVSNDTNDHEDIFVHDRQTGITSRVSVNSNGTQGNIFSWSPDISSDGRYIVYNSSATNLVDNDTNNHLDIFVYDQQTGQTSRVSIASNGMEGNDASSSPDISANGRYVTFQSEATNLVNGDDIYGIDDIFVHDRHTGRTTLVSIASNGVKGNDFSSSPTMSADGRYIAFASHATNLINNDTNEAGDIFVHDRETGQTNRVSITSNGAEFNGSSSSPSISADGRYVAFESSGSAFVHDRQTSQTNRISVAWDGTEYPSSPYISTISADGRYVTFDSYNDNLLLGDTNDYRDTFRYDRQTGQTTRVSMAWGGAQSNNHTFWSNISEGGRYVAFNSNASNLINNDTNGYQDVFVRDMNE